MKNFFIKGLLLLLILFSVFIVYSQIKSGSNDFKRKFLESINRMRAQGCTCGVTYMPPAPPLKWNNNLEIAAKGHAQDMADQNYFSHTSRDGRTMEDRIALAGYTFKGFKSFAIGENIASGQESIPEVMEGWRKSEGHCKNLMNPHFKEVGVAESNLYWVQDFGAREPFTPQEQKLIKSGRYRLIEKGN